MNAKALIAQAIEHMRTATSMKEVYGEPRLIDGKTIIPVARVAYGRDPGPRAGDQGHRPDQTITARPVGVVEVGPDETRFVPLHRRKPVAIAALLATSVGFLVGLVIGRRARRRGDD